MNLADARIVIRPRGRLEIMDLAFRYVLGDARRKFAYLALLSLSPVFAAIVAARVFLDASWWWLWAIALVLGTLVSGVFTVASGNMLFERTLNVREVLREYGRRFPQFLVALIESRVLIALGSLLIVPGLIAWKRHAHLSEAVLLERVPLRRAFARSAVLSREGGGSVAGLLVAIFSMSTLIALGTETIVLAIVEEVLVLPVESQRLFIDGGSYPAIAGFLLSLPWAAASRFLAYIDGRTRQDGWDVQIRLMALDGGAA